MSEMKQQPPSIVDESVLQPTPTHTTTTTTVPITTETDGVPNNLENEDAATRIIESTEHTSSPIEPVMMRVNMASLQSRTVTAGTERTRGGNNNNNNNITRDPNAVSEKLGPLSSDATNTEDDEDPVSTDVVLLKPASASAATLEDDEVQVGDTMMFGATTNMVRPKITKPIEAAEPTRGERYITTSPIDNTYRRHDAVERGVPTSGANIREDEDEDEDEDDDDKGEMKPGAYSVRGRAFGSIPAWIRGRSSITDLFRAPSTRMSDQSQIPPELRVVATDSSNDYNRDLRPDEETNAPMGVSTTEEEEQENSCLIRKSYVIAGITVMILVIILGVGLGLVLSSPSAPDSSEATQKEVTFYRKMVEDLTISDPFVLENPAAPQYQALMWLAANTGYHHLMTDERIRTRYALAVLYYSTQGEKWSVRANFLKNIHECEWFTRRADTDNTGERSIRGVECNIMDQVQNLSLGFNQLAGSLPEELNALGHLQYLNLTSNKLTGSLPSWTELTSLHTLDCNSNGLTSTIPSSIFLLQNMTHITLNRNLFSGTLPESIGNSQKLRFLYLDDNDLAGSLPVSFTQLDSLEGLSVTRNKLIGSLPSTLGSMTALEALFVSGNSLNGTFPWQSFALGDCSLRELDISRNSFSGSMPWEAILTNFTCLEGLFLGNSGVTGGSLPSTGFQNLTSLELFDLEKMNLIGTIPESIGDMMRLTRLHMDDNSLEGTIPSSLGRLQKLRTLRLQMNSLTGTVPTELENILGLEEINLSRNNLNGSLDFFCPLTLTLSTLVADCDDSTRVRLDCSCCTSCGSQKV